jgi:2,4-dienoyl-CoA reductase (NADPH2)
VIATGARVDVMKLPASTQPGLVVDAVDVAMGRVKAGNRVVVIGAGKIGLTLAESLATQKHDVTVVESDRRIAGDVMPSFKWRHTQWLQELNIPVRVSTRVTAIGDGGVNVVDGKGETAFLPADTVIAATAAEPNQELFHELEWMIDELHGCGDSLVPLGLTRAIHAGYQLGARL